MNMNMNMNMKIEARAGDQKIIDQGMALDTHTHTHILTHKTDAQTSMT